MSEYINNRQARKKALRKLILDLHAGGDLEEIRARFSKLIGHISSIEIAQMEQELIDEGLPAEEIKALCDVHTSLFQEALEDEASPEMIHGHPVHTFRFENLAVGEILKLLGEAIAALPDENAFDRARRFAERLAEVNKVYLRKENLLFPLLEKHGVSGPSSVMWGIHDDIRAQIRALREALRKDQAGQVRAIYDPLSTAIEQMIYKEEKILYPTALKVLSDAEWLAIRDQSEEIGYCLIRPGEEWKPDISEPAEIPSARSYGAPASEQIKLDTGALTPEQINLLLTHLPIDATFVDENDVVRYFTEGREGRVFTRTKAIIGRKVQNCHPPSSVHIVNKLLDELRSGARDVAEFWIQIAGKFVHIRYFALRDANGKYRGTIEVTQDVSAIRQLEGERRLLDEAE